MVAEIDLNKFIRDKHNEHVEELYETVDKDVHEFLAENNLSLEDFAKDYILVLGSTKLEKVHSGVVDMDLDMQPDTSTGKLVTHYRIRRKTAEEKAADDNRE